MRRLGFAFVSAGLWCSGCSSMPTAPPATGGNTLTGSDAFVVNSTAIDTTTPKGDCGDATSLPGGGYASFVLLLSDMDLTSDAASLVSTPPAGAHVVRVEFAGPSYTDVGTQPDGGAPAPVTPGTYAIGFEGEDDDDLCMLPAGTSAILDLFDFSGDGSTTQMTAASGSITLTSVATGRIQGSFRVQMSDSPFRVTQPTVPLSGTFDVTGE